MASRRRFSGTIRSLVNVRDLKLECARVLYETLLVSILMYGSETMIWREKKRPRVRAVQMDNLRGLLGIRRLDRIPNKGGVRELCGVRKGLDERIHEGFLQWRGWRGIVFPRKWAGNHSVCSQGRDGLIP